MFRILVLAIMTNAIASLCCAEDEIAFSLGTKLWLVQTSDAHVRLVTDLPDYDRPLTWSPDGERILFWKHSEIGWDFWTVLSDGKDPRRLTTTESGGYRSASYSADGSRIAYMRDLPEGLYIMNADGTGQRRLTEFGHRDGIPSWSPDGDSLLFYNLRADEDRKQQAGLYTIDATAENPKPHYVAAGTDGSYSPTRNEIVCLQRNESGLDVVVVDVANGKSRNLTNSAASDYSPVWSPDGDKIAFARTAANEQLEIHVIARDGAMPQLLATVPTVGEPRVAWSPDGTSVAFLAMHEEEPSLFVIDASGGKPRYLAGGMLEFSWRPHGIELEGRH